MRTRCSGFFVGFALFSAGSLMVVSAQTKFGVTVQTSSPDKLAKVATYQWTGGLAQPAGRWPDHRRRRA